MTDNGIPLGPDDLEAAVAGGAVLGGGGGGTIAEGLRLGREALAAGTPRLLALDAVQPDALVATASLVGAPGDPRARVAPADYTRAWELVRTLVERPIEGVISCENGGTASVHGWLQSAVFGVPVIDAPANGRAHPTADMGGMGLERMDEFVAIQAAAGGNRETGAYLEQRVTGSLAATNRLVRAAAEEAGGLVGVARNPIAASYLQDHAAPGGLSQALELGRRMVAGRSSTRPEAIVNVLIERLAAAVIARGEVREYALRSEGAYDVGIARVGGAELTIWNEYLTLDVEGERIATFPDLIVTLDQNTGHPLTSAELSVGRSVVVLAAPASQLILGAGVRCPEHFVALEAAVRREILKYVGVDVLTASEGSTT
ncbi:MAG TPA: DUF917 family protein [Vicinamibacterales bacterium]